MMFKVRDWDWTDWFIGAAILGIIVAAGLGIFGVVKHSKTQCIGGYLFTNPIQMDYRFPTTPVQVLDNSGRGIPCTEVE